MNSNQFKSDQTTSIEPNQIFYNKFDLLNDFIFVFYENDFNQLDKIEFDLI